MKLGTIRLDGKETVIARVDDSNAVALAPATMEDLIVGGDAALDAARKAIDKGAAGEGSVLLDMGIAAELRYTTFENTGATASFNVRSSVDGNPVDLVNYSGLFQGEEHEDDPFDQVDWLPAEDTELVPGSFELTQPGEAAAAVWGALDRFRAVFSRTYSAYCRGNTAT